MKNAISSKIIKNIAALRSVLEQKELLHKQAQEACKKAYRAYDRARTHSGPQAQIAAKSVYYRAYDREMAAYEAVTKAEHAVLREVLRLAPNGLGKQVMEAWVV